MAARLKISPLQLYDLLGMLQIPKLRQFSGCKAHRLQRSAGPTIQVKQAVFDTFHYVHGSIFLL